MEEDPSQMWKCATSASLNPIEKREQKSRMYIQYTPDTHTQNGERLHTCNGNECGFLICLKEEHEKPFLPFSTSFRTFYYYVVHLFMRWNMYYTQSIPYLFEYTFSKYLTGVLGRIYLNIIYVPLHGFAGAGYILCIRILRIYVEIKGRYRPIIVYIRV